jgi:hypothetical protein
LAIPTVILLATGCSADRPARPAALVGAWRSSLRFESGALAAAKDLEFMYVFNEGGTMTESSNYEFYSTAPSSPDAFKTGAGWLPSGHGVLTERIKLAVDGQTFTSTIRYDAFNAKGEPAEGGGEAKGRAERIGF